MPDKRRWRMPLAFLVLLSRTLFGNVVVQPTFGHPFIYADRIVFTSVDGTHLIGIDKHGRKQWEIQFPERIFEQRMDDRFLLVQYGRRVVKVDVQKGTQSELLTMPEFQLLIVGSSDKSFLYSVDSRLDHHRIQILEPSHNTALWESSTIESITHITATTIVAVKAERVMEGDAAHRGYHFERADLCGYDRLDGHVRWSIPLAEAQLGSVRSAAMGNSLGQSLGFGRNARTEGYVLAVIDGIFSPQLLVLNPDTGEVLSRRKGKFLDLWESDGSLSVLESGVNPGQAKLYSCTLPDCGSAPALALSAREILKFRMYRDYVITAGIYDSACFVRSTGQRLWRKGQLEWSEPFGTKMIVTASKRRIARIVSIDLRSGAEHVLFAQPVTKKDSAAFAPW